jgi:hypothetical protein
MSGLLDKQFWTYKLSNDTLMFNGDFGLSALSFTLLSGTGSVKGTLVANGYASTSIILKIGQPLLISTDTSSLIGDLEITTTGDLNLIGR